MWVWYHRSLEATWGEYINLAFTPKEQPHYHQHHAWSYMLGLVSWDGSVGFGLCLGIAMVMRKVIHHNKNSSIIIQPPSEHQEAAEWWSTGKPLCTWFFAKWTWNKTRSGTLISESSLSHVCQIILTFLYIYNIYIYIYIYIHIYIYKYI